MSLEYVARGEGIKASTVNSLIDAVAGRGNMSPDLIVTGTKNGPQLVVPTQLGSSSLKKDSVFDIENYTLSGWPMAKVKLGSKLENALEAVRVHTEDGIQNATSALLVFKNSATCPFGGGTLSGYQLEDSHFGTEAAYGDTGWVKTKMEGVFGQTEPNIQVWKTKDNVIEVIGNVDADEAKQKLSSLLNEGGMEASDLSTLKFLEQFPLVSQTCLQAGSKSKPTSRVTMKHGIVDVYSYGTEKNQRAMLKAYLVCYSVEDGQEGAKDSHWTWLIPLGSGAAYNQTSEGVWTTQFTYGGDPIILDAEEGSLDRNFNGSPTWIERSEFGNQVIAFGKFDSDGSSEIEPGEVWIDLEYDYQKFAVKGTVNNGESDPPTSQAVLGTAIKIAEAEAYKPKDDVVAGTEVHPSYIFNGTLGDLFKGEPKLDSYTPKDSQTGYNSLQWTERGKDGEQWQGGVTCRCLELYGFDNAEPSDPTSADWYVARRYDSETSSATLVYVPLSADDVIPDSTLTSAQTSSLAWRTIVSADPEDDSESSSIDVLQLYGFDLMSSYIKDLNSASLSGEYECHVLLRNATLSTLEYLALSALSATPDSHGMSGQKSIGILSTDAWNPTELQLYAFDEDGEDGVSVQLGAVPQTLLSDTYEFVVRKGGKGGEVSYIKIAAAAGDLVDSSSDEAQTSSLEVRSISAGDEVSNVIQLWHFDHMTQRYWELSDALSGHKDVVLRDTETSAVAYMSLSCLSSTPLCVDSEGSTGQKSISFFEDENYQRELQLYKFNEAGEEGSSVKLDTDPALLLPADYEFIVRKGGLCGEVSYIQLSAEVRSTAEADSAVPESQTSSLEVRKLSSEEDGISSVMQFWHFNRINERYTELSDALSNQTDVVLRDADTSSVTYVALSCLSSIPLCVDTEGNSGQKSVDFLDEDGKKQLQLYNMDQNGETLNDVQLTTTAVAVLPQGYEFVVRKNGAGGEISYAKFNMIGGGGSGGGDCSCDLQPELTSGTKIAQWTKDGVNWTDIYCLSGGGGGEISVYGTDNSMHAGSEFHFASAADSNVSVNIDGSGVMTVGVYYL